MIITYHGLECFKMQFGNTVIATNPPSKSSKAFSKVPKFGADIVVQSLNHPDFNGGENMSYGDKVPYVVKGPGEYEIQDILIQGFQTVSHLDGKEYLNTLYSLVFEGMHIVFAGPLGVKDLPKTVIENVEAVDILFVPVSGDGVLDASDAYKLGVELEARLIIPMHFDDKSLKTFLKEGSAETVKPEDKFTLKRRDLDGMEGEIAVLNIQ